MRWHKIIIMKLNRPLKLYAIFLLITIVAYPKITCLCLNPGNYCFPSPLLGNLLTLMIMFAALMSAALVITGQLILPNLLMTLLFLPHLLLILLLPALSIILYGQMEKRRIFPGILMKNKYLGSWIVSAIIVLIIDFFFSVYVLPLCFGVS
jgi:hypothetical protein